MLLDYYSALGYIRALTDKQGLNLKWIPKEAPDQTPRTDGQTIWVSVPNPLWTKSEYVLYLNGIKHEIGHNLDPCNDAWDYFLENPVDMDSLFGHVLNCTDDYRNDFNRCHKYPGMLVTQKEVAPYRVHKISSIPAWSDPNEADNLWLEVFRVMLPFDWKARQSWITSITNSELSMMRHFNAVDRTRYNILIDKYFDRYMSMTSIEEEVEFCKEILEEVFEIPEQEYSRSPDKPGYELPNNPGEDDGEEDGTPGEDGTPVEGSQGEDESEDGGKSESSKSEDSKDSRESEETEDSDDEGSKPSKKKKIVPYEEILESNHTKTMKAEPGGEIRIDYSRWEGSTRYSDYSPHTFETTKIINLHTPNNGNSSDNILDRSSTVSPKIIDEKLDTMNINALAFKVRRIIQIETKSKTEYNRKRGKIHGSKLHRIVSGSSDSEKRKVFKKVAENKALDAAFYFLGDSSGSMYHSNKIATSSASLFALSEVCRTLRINHEIATFTEYNQNKNLHVICKEFGKSISPEKLKKNISKSTSVMVENADGDNILLAYHRLLKQPEPRKILCVLSDGSPASRRGDIATFTLDVTKRIQEDRRIDLLGIGILDSNVELFYNDCQVISAIEELPQVLLETLKRCILTK